MTPTAKAGAASLDQHQILLGIHAHSTASGVRVWVDWQARPPARSATLTTADNALTSIPRFCPHFPVAFLPRARAPLPTRLLLHTERPQGLSMLVYHPLEHAHCLTSHSILPLSPAKHTSWSCRGWAAYVVLQLVHLKEDWRLVKRRERALVNFEITAV